MLSDFELELHERKHFDYILIYLKQNLSIIVDRLNSRIDILNDWYGPFTKTARKGYKSSDLDMGAERVFHNIIAPLFRFPNSSPVGSDLMFELPDAFVHIDIKTALITNPADYKGKINIGVNQTSYQTKTFEPNLPKYYNISSTNTIKPCLTYVIQIIHEHAQPDIKAMVLACIPNGQLYSHYGQAIIKSGKSGYAKAKDFRYHYAAEPYFKLLSRHYNQKIFRVELIYLDKNLKTEDITGLKEIPVHSSS